MKEIGFVYVLTSPNCACLKIGGTRKALAERIREINSSIKYWADLESGLNFDK